jgi:transposase
MAISRDEKVQVVELMLAGHDWQEATEQVGITISQSTAYRWVRCWRQDGRAGLSDGRQGHAHKMTAEVRAWLAEYCGQARHTPSRVVRKLIKERFKVEISRGHINRVRAELGVSRPKKSRS